MKILIGTNTFGNYHRQTVAIDSWQYLVEQCVTNYDAPYSVSLVDIQFRNEEKTFVKNPFLKTVFPLECSSKDWVDGATKKLPVISDVIYSIYEEAVDYDYFIYTNSDVIIMPNLLDYILNNQPDAMACSRLDIQNIDSFQSILDQKVTPVRYEIAGFDTFVFKKSWFEKNKDELLRGVYFIGKPLWDVILAGKIKILGDSNVELGNGYPPYCFHIHHGLDSVTTECPEKSWVEDQMKRLPFDHLVHNMMFYHLKNNLIKREPWGSFMKPQKGEKEFEKSYFDVMNFNTKKSVV